MDYNNKNTNALKVVWYKKNAYSVWEKKHQFIKTTTLFCTQFSFEIPAKKCHYAVGMLLYIVL